MRQMLSGIVGLRARLAVVILLFLFAPVAAATYYGPPYKIQSIY
jgi:hypothetical protein